MFIVKDIKRAMTIPRWSQALSSDGYFPAIAISPAETVSSFRDKGSCLWKQMTKGNISTSSLYIYQTVRRNSTGFPWNWVFKNNSVFLNTKFTLIPILQK